MVTFLLQSFVQRCIYAPRNAFKWLSFESLQVLALNDQLINGTLDEWDLKKFMKLVQVKDKEAVAQILNTGPVTKLLPGNPPIKFTHGHVRKCSMSEREARDYEDFDHLQILSPKVFKAIADQTLKQLTYDCSTLLLWDTISRRPAMMSFKANTNDNFNKMVSLLAYKCRKSSWMT